MTGERVLHISPIACDGRGLCAEIAPELITLDDWGFPMIEPGAVPLGLMAEAEAAVRICPLLALRLAASAPDHARSRRSRSGQGCRAH